MRLRPVSTVAVTALCLIAACGGKSSAHEPAHWGYEGAEAPSHWATLDSDYSTCGSGKQQSPIDIVTAAAVSEDLPPLEIDYAEVPLDVLNTGHGILCNVPAGSTLRVGDQDYALLQFHFHSPSEHTIDGEHADFEVHFVHENDAGEFAAVVGLMLRAGAETSVLDAIWQHAPAEAGATATPAGVTIDLQSIFPEDLGYYGHSGSLTTPPCSDGVSWFVLREDRTLSAAQLAGISFAGLGNNRPVEVLNGRIVRSSK